MKLCILDRDGTINEDSADFVKFPNEWRPLPGALEAIAKLKAAVTAIPHVAATPAPDVEILSFTPEGPLLCVRPYTHTDHYWQVYFDTNETIVRVAREAGWPAPTPALVSRIIQAG